MKSLLIALLAMLMAMTEHGANIYPSGVPSASPVNIAQEQLWIATNEADLEFTKLRYKKGIELTKMLYEKILGLDHHFTSLQTFQNISDLTNPNSFPEFVKRKDAITDRISKKKSVSIPSLFEANPFVSLTTTLISSLVGDGQKDDKEEDLEQVACVLDFTGCV